MHRLVYSVFKTIMLSMIFIFAFDMLSYLYRAMSLNQRMESLMVSMQRTVMENNYLTDGAKDTYDSIFDNLKTSVNTGEEFITDIKMNYGTDAVNTINSIKASRGGTNSDILVKDMKKVGAYGDVMVVQVAVTINQPMWGFENNSYRADDFTRTLTNQTTLSYTYYVPCLKYSVGTA